jgi:transcriptional regulator GlxA family with amidase domain
VVVAFDGVVLADLAGPCELFSRVRTPDGRKAYDVRVCAERGAVSAGLVRLAVPWSLVALRTADTIIIPGMDERAPAPSARLVRALRQAISSGTRVASVCTGAFVLATTGALDGHRATTHWRAAAELKRRHPRIEVDAGVLYVDNGSVLTSAGAAAALDLCLHLVRRDFGAEVAARAARDAVMPLERAGGQAQFIEHPAPESAGSIAPMLEWVERHVEHAHDLRSMARRAAMSTRTLSRRFVEQTGTTPRQWLIAARVRRAQQLLETTRLDVERVASAVGFGSATALRQHFRSVLGTAPTLYRRAFGNG